MNQRKIKKNILLLGRLSINIPNTESGITQKNINLFSGTNYEDVKRVFADNNNMIDMVIMGAGIDIDARLNIIRYYI